ncbi:MAG TPA: VOC family protein [Actinomycetospora sp.]|jgi:hypothetical protein|uniref:VOC family protein n=1 Tax=Actinomycetospora sp. TaxID=1872135 RepID=UPI002F3E2A82
MSSVQTSPGSTVDPTDQTTAMRLEVVVLPVADVDRALAFYRGLGWRLDADVATGPGFRVVQPLRRVGR